MQRPIPEHVAYAQDARALRGVSRRRAGTTPTSVANTRAGLFGALTLLVTTVAGCGLPQTNPSAVANPEGAPSGGPARAEPAPRDGAVAAVRERQDAQFQAAGPYRPATLPHLSLTPPMLYELLAAEIAVQRQQLQSAYNSFSSLAAQTRDARLARRATEVALGGRAFEQALTSSRLWAELDPASDEPKQAVEALLLATNRLTEVEPLLRQRLATARDKQQVDAYYGHLQRTLTRIEDRKGAWALLQRLSRDDLELLSARRTRAVMAEVAGDREAAIEETRAALRLAPDDAATAIQVARLLQGQPDKGSARAATLLEDFVRSHPDEPTARLALARVYLAERQTKPARATLDAALKRQPEDPPTLFLAAQAAYQAKDLGAARQLLNRFTGLPETVERDNAPAWLFLGQVAEDERKPAEAIGYLQRIDGGELYLPALNRRALLMARSGDHDGAMKLLDTTEPRTAQERQGLVSARASILRESQRYQEAFDLLDKALADNPDSPELLYDQAMAAEKIGRLEALEKSLRHLMTLQPDNAHAFNALGYTLADRNLRLDEARQLIEKALELSPDDPQIIDSLGWVHFRLGNTKEALGYLRRAYELLPDVEVAAHLGEVLWQTGAQDEALRVWREASGRDASNEVLRGTLARLNISL